MKETEQKLVFKGQVATIENFSQILSENPKILHISCHGLRLSEKRSTITKDDVNEIENFLAFETKSGEGELINYKTLKKLIAQKVPDLDVIFLAACNSEFAGEIFLKCGAKHVICI